MTPPPVFARLPSLPVIVPPKLPLANDTDPPATASRPPASVVITDPLPETVTVPEASVAIVAAPPMVVDPPATRPIVAEPDTIVRPPDTVPLVRLPADTVPPVIVAASPRTTVTDPDDTPPVIAACLANHVEPTPVSDESVIVPVAAVNDTAAAVTLALLTEPSVSPVPLMVANPEAATLSGATPL